MNPGCCYGGKTRALVFSKHVTSADRDTCSRQRFSIDTVPLYSSREWALVYSCFHQKQQQTNKQTNKQNQALGPKMETKGTSLRIHWQNDLVKQLVLLA